jgi:transposase-like protein
MGRRRYSEETKAAVMAALLAGQSIAEVAEAYNIPQGTVAYWSAKMDRPLDQGDPSTKKEIGDLILEYLRVTLRTLAEQQRVFADAKWLKLQPASELAVLHGVSADKAIRLLEALSADDRTDGDGPTGATRQAEGD